MHATLQRQQCAIKLRENMHEHFIALHAAFLPALPFKEPAPKAD